MSNGSGMFSKQAASKAHLLQGGGIGGEVANVRRDIGAVLAPLAAFTVDEFTNPPALDVDGIKTAIATAVTAQEYTGAALNGVVGAGVLSPPRPPSVTASNSPGSYAGGVTYEGFDVDGHAISEVVPIVDNATTVGNKMFARFTSVAPAAQLDLLGSLSFGFGIKMGLSKTIKARAGLVGVVREIAGGVLVTTGTFEDAATAAPHGSYQPADAPDGAKDYAIYYEWNAALDPDAT